MSQPALDAALGVPKGYTAKLETGRVSPTPEFLDRFAEFSGIPVDQLSQLEWRKEGATSLLTSNATVGTRPAREAIPPKSEEILRIAFGHSTWATPIVLAMMKGTLKNVAFTSFREQGSKKPVWLDSQFRRVLLADAEGIDHARDRTESPKQSAFPGPNGKDAGLDPLSAREALDILGNREADLAAVPMQALEGKDLEVFDRVATIVDSATGCIFVTDIPDCLEIAGVAVAQVGPDPSPKAPAGVARACSTSALADWIAKLLRHSPDKEFVVVARGLTAAETWYKDIVRRVRRMSDGDGGRVTRVDGATGSMKERAYDKEWTYANLKKEYQDPEDGRRQLLGVITWEPHASWLVERAGTSEAEGAQATPRKILLHVPPVDGADLDYLSVDLFVRRVGARFGARPMIWDLLEELRMSARTAQSLGSRPEEARVLARYFDLADPDLPDKDLPKVIDRLVCTVRFCVYPHMTYLNTELRSR